MISCANAISNSHPDGIFSEEAMTDWFSVKTYLCMGNLKLDAETVGAQSSISSNVKITGSNKI